MTSQSPANKTFELSPAIIITNSLLGRMGRFVCRVSFQNAIKEGPQVLPTHANSHFIRQVMEEVLHSKTTVSPVRFLTLRLC